MHIQVAQGVPNTKVHGDALGGLPFERGGGFAHRRKDEPVRVERVIRQVQHVVEAGCSVEEWFQCDVHMGPHDCGRVAGEKLLQLKKQFQAREEGPSAGRCIADEQDIEHLQHWQVAVLVKRQLAVQHERLWERAAAT